MIDDQTLAELEKTQPELVAQYRAKMSAPDAGVQSARNVQDYGTVANAAGSALSALGNANRAPDVVLHNSMRNLGGTPSVQRTPERDYDPSVIDDVTSRNLTRAKEDQGKAEGTFWNEQKLSGLQRDRDWQDKERTQTQNGWTVENARNSPDSPQANQAKLLLKNALLAKATEAAEAGRQGVPGATEAANQLKAQAQNAGDGLGANDIMSQYKLINETSYDKVLDIRAKKAGMDASNAYRQSLQDERTSRKRAESVQKLRKDLETFRGNPAAAQAARDVLSADKALSIVKGKDPNSLTTQELNLLAGEMAKIATGGIPTEHGVQALMPNNLQTKAAEMQSFLASKPTDAQAGEYVTRNLKYLEEMSSVARDAVNTYRGNILKGYKGLVDDSDIAEAQQDYALTAPERAEAPAPAAAATASAPAASEVERLTSDGRTAIFDANTKKFLRYK